jgi:iron-sulfur cluster insertion protein
MITITERAIAQLKEISDGEGIGHYSVRVKVVGSGCAGFSHDMFFDDKPFELDEIINVDDITIMVDPLSFQYLENVEIDYIDNPISSGFKFNNPSIKGSCGCGNSVSY